MGTNNWLRRHYGSVCVSNVSLNTAAQQRLHFNHSATSYRVAINHQRMKCITNLRYDCSINRRRNAWWRSGDFSNNFVYTIYVFAKFGPFALKVFFPELRRHFFSFPFCFAPLCSVPDKRNLREVLLRQFCHISCCKTMLLLFLYNLATLILDDVQKRP